MMYFVWDWKLTHARKTVYEIKLGTLDVDEADKEWVLRPYQRTAKKRDFM
jgi:hypothetical protein